MRKDGENFKWILNNYKFKLFILLVILIAITALLQYMNFGFSNSIFENISLQLLGTLFILLIVDKFIQLQSDKDKNDKFNKYALSKYSILVNNIMSHLDNLITKEPAPDIINLSRLNELEKKIDDMDEEFFKTRILILLGKKDDMASFDKVTIPYLKKVSLAKNDINDKINEFQNKFLFILPDEILSSLLEIDRILSDDLFVSPVDFGYEGINYDVLATENGINDRKKLYKLLLIECKKLMFHSELKDVEVDIKFRRVEPPINRKFY